MPKPSPIQSGERKVFRDELKELRDGFFVTYSPSDSRFNLATVDLVFVDQVPDAKEIKARMESELNYWLERFPVPAMVGAFDATGAFIHLPGDSHTSHLMGYTEPLTKMPVRRWGLYSDKELPAEQLNEAYLAKVYKAVPFRFADIVRQQAERDHKRTTRAIKLFAFFIVAVPVGIELVSLGVEWIGHLLAGASILAGLYKVCKTMGWVKRSKIEEEKAEKEQKMAHYYYHCERNPHAFEKLKCESFKKEAIERTQREAAELHSAS